MWDIFFILQGLLYKQLLKGKCKLFWGEKDWIKKLKDHYIICGYGRIGRVLCHLIKDEKKDLVVIAKDDDLIEILEKDKSHYLHGDVSDETLLEKAGIKNASFLIAALGSDVSNVFLVLTARQLNPDIYILARASHQDVKNKLLIAGANHVESPYDIGAVSMGLQLLRPSVSSFLNIALSRRKEAIQIEELFIPKTSKYTNIALKDSRIRQDFNLIIIAIKKASGTMLFNPHFETLIEPLDTVIVMGKTPDLKQFATAINPKSNF